MIKDVFSKGRFALRVFLGSKDPIQQVTLYGMFPASSIIIASPVEMFDDWPAIVVEGPEFQISFLYDHFLKLIEANSNSEEEKWNGILRQRADRVDLSYKFSPTPEGLIELIESKFRRDLMLYTNLKLSEEAILEVIYANKQILRTSIGLPKGTENGSIEIPLLILH